MCPLRNTEIMIPKCDLIQFQSLQLKVESIQMFELHGASLDNRRRLGQKVIIQISATFYCSLPLALTLPVIASAGCPDLDTRVTTVHRLSP